MRLEKAFNRYPVSQQVSNAPSSSTHSVHEIVNSLMRDVPNFFILKNRLAGFNTAQNDEIKRRLIRIRDLLSQDKSKVALFTKVTDSDCVAVVIEKLDRIVGLLEGQGIASVLGAAKEEVLRTIITCFVNAPALGYVHHYATETKRWFVAHRSVQHYDPKALFNLPFNLNLGEPHFVNTFFNHLASTYALPRISRDVDHHTISFTTTEGSPLSDKLFRDYKELLKEHLVFGQGMSVQVRNIEELLDKMIKEMKSKMGWSNTSVAAYAAAQYRLCRYYNTSLDGYSSENDLRAAILLHLIPYMAQEFVAKMLEKEDAAQMWLASAATQLLHSLPNSLEGDGYPKLEKNLSAISLRVNVDALTSDVRARFQDAFQVDAQGNFRLEAKHFVDCDDDYKLYYKASRHTLLTIMAAIVATQQGLLAQRDENMQAQIAFLVWQQDPEQNKDLYRQVCQPWGIVYADDQGVRIREVEQNLRDLAPAPLTQSVQAETLPQTSRSNSTRSMVEAFSSSTGTHFYDSGRVTTDSLGFTGLGAKKNSSPSSFISFSFSTGGRPGDGLAVMLDAFVNRPYSYDTADVRNSAIKKDFSGRQYMEKKLLNILEYARLNPRQSDFPLGSNQKLKSCLTEHKNFLATYCVLVLANSKGNPAQEYWLRRFFEEIQRVMAEPVDKSIDQRVNKFFAQASNSNKFADVLSRPLSPQVYSANRHFFSMGFDSFKKIATAVNKVQVQRSKEGIWARTTRLLMWFWYCITFRRPVHEVIKTYGFFNKNKHAQAFYRNYTGLRP